DHFTILHFGAQVRPSDDTVPIPTIVSWRRLRRSQDGVSESAPAQEARQLKANNSALKERTYPVPVTRTPPDFVGRRSRAPTSHPSSPTRRLRGAAEENDAQHRGDDGSSKADSRKVPVHHVDAYHSGNPMELEERSEDAARCRELVKSGSSQRTNVAMGIRMDAAQKDVGLAAFSEDILKNEISGPDQEHLTVIDVPGIFRVLTPGLTTESDIVLVENMVKSYMANRRRGRSQNCFRMYFAAVRWTGDESDAST
ncbi:interferon-induced GTP-binding protein mx2, partial [Colletotrichum tofieldiae]